MQLQVILLCAYALSVAPFTAVRYHAVSISHSKQLIRNTPTYKIRKPVQRKTSATTSTELRSHDNLGENTKVSVGLAENTKASIGLVLLFAINSLTLKLFRMLHVAFPASLFAMMLVFISLIGLGKYSEDSATTVLEFFLPAITFIKSWLPLFFVPPLVVIPLKYHLVQGKILKFLSVIVIGGLMSMTSSAL